MDKGDLYIFDIYICVYIYIYMYMCIYEKKLLKVKPQAEVLAFGEYMFEKF